MNSNMRLKTSELRTGVRSVHACLILEESFVRFAQRLATSSVSEAILRSRRMRSDSHLSIRSRVGGVVASVGSVAVVGAGAGAMTRVEADPARCSVDMTFHDRSVSL
jgi:hypothetical protein